MALAPVTTPAPSGRKTPALNETAMAIIASLVLSLVFATLFTGNPFRATRLAYTDYSKVQAAPGAPATQAPRR